MDMQNKVAVITGGASGLGAATARYFVATKGAKVAIFDLNSEAGAKLVEELGPDKACFVRVDVTDEGSVKKGLDCALTAFGAVHICVNCAGIPLPAKILDRDGCAMPLDKFRAVVDVNLVGLFNVMSKCAEQMARNEPDSNEERGVIINISSGAAYDGQIGQCAYGASKAGVTGLNMPAARELGDHGIRVNAIAPGLFHTPMVDSLGPKVVESLVKMMEAPRRMGKMEEFAHLCAALVENGYVNGETVRIHAATMGKSQ